MGATEQRNRSQKTAADLLRRGIFHGKRQSSPRPNSGGRTMVMNVVGSSRYQRRMGIGPYPKNHA